MGWRLLRLTANILAFLRLTVNFVPLRLTDVLKINFHCFKKLKINFHCCKVFRPFWDKKVHFIIIVDKVNCCNKLKILFGCIALEEN